MEALFVSTGLVALRASLINSNRCLLIAQPGAGKTTRVPLALLGDTAPGMRWLMLEPRRVAARLAANYMAEQLNEKPGQTIGYRVRGDSKVSASTRVEVVTQGILTRMLQDDPALAGVAGLIFDEFHERSLDADLGLALALDVQQGLREDLRILVMSATLDTHSLLKVMEEHTPVIDCPGRQWPVATFYRSPPLREPAEQYQAIVVLEALRNYTRLETRQVNRASADQRRGRAGREADGFCYRLWSKETSLAAHREPEINQSDLAALAFELARWGVSDPAALSWVTRPPCLPGVVHNNC